MTCRAFYLACAAAVLAAGCNSIFGIHRGTPRPICADPLMIDDMEDGDGAICSSGGRYGGWYDFGDGTQGAQLTPPANTPFQPSRIRDGSRGTSLYAARFSGSGFAKFGATMGMRLKAEGQPDDVTGLGGVTFWMKSDVPVAVQFPTLETAQVGDGGECLDSATEVNCDNHLFFQITAPAPGWSQYWVPFNALSQRPGGSAIWNPRHLLNIQFGVPAGAAFEVWIDDIAFYYCAGPECQPSCSDPNFPVPCRAMDGSRSSCQLPDTDCDSIASRCADPLMIDDMEDGDANICASGGRQGAWYVSDDGTSTDLTPNGSAFVQTMIPGGRGTSHYAARLTGSGFTGFALMGFGFAAPYDASAQSGIKFWMKNNVPVSVSFPTLETNAPDQGGLCADGPYICNNRFAFRITASGSDWVEYQVPFSALSQNDGTATWNPSHLLHIDFSPRSEATPFDVWVDDIRFYNCAASDCFPTCPDPALPKRCLATALAPAGCRRPETDCATFVLGCDASNTKLPPVNGVIATFDGADSGADIMGDVFALGDPALTTTTTTDGALHIALSAPRAPVSQRVLVVDHFKDCVDATTFTGVTFSISGFVSGCTLGYFTEDGSHLFDDGAPYGTHGTARAGIHPAFVALAAGQITSATQTLMLPFAGVLAGFPQTPIDQAKVTGVGWAFSIAPSTDSDAPPCVADLTIDDVRFY